MSKKVPPVIPVVGGGAAADTSREDELREWEEQQARQRQQQAAQSAAPAAPVVSVPAPAVEPSPAAPPVVQAEPAADTGVAVPNEAPGYLVMPAFTDPVSDDPAVRLEFYTRGIEAVEYAARANHERAEQQRLIGIGLRLRAIKAEELHKTAGYDTFGALVDATMGFKKHYANNILRVLGVAQALEDITTQELKERPLRVLVPV
ncbi:MAG: hypothetical protein ACRD0H_03235, partial [Actinomycetes bacterium]